MIGIDTNVLVRFLIDDNDRQCARARGFLADRTVAVKGPYYTVIATVYDEVVTPYTSQFLAGSSKQVTNITIQDKCPLDPIEHDQAPNDPVVHQLVAHALSRTGAPADPAYQPRCL